MTYLPDDQPPDVQRLPDGVRLTGRPHPLDGLQKCIQLRLLPDRAAVQVHHRIQNRGQRPVELAPWSITQMPPGGVALLPQRMQPLGGAHLLPNRVLVLWPGNDLTDPRLTLHGAYWQVRASGGPRLKIGWLNVAGWMAYLHSGRVFVKRFEPRPGARLPDLGVNAEVYTDDNMLELETLGPLVTLAPGEAVEHEETWEAFPSPNAPGLDPEVAAAIAGVEVVQGSEKIAREQVEK